MSLEGRSAEEHGCVPVSATDWSPLIPWNLPTHCDRFPELPQPIPTGIWGALRDVFCSVGRIVGASPVPVVSDRSLWL